MRLTCYALLKHVSLGRAGARQPPRLVPEETGIDVAVGKQPACVASFSSASSNDQSRPRSFKLGWR